MSGQDEYVQDKFEQENEYGTINKTKKINWVE